MEKALMLFKAILGIENTELDALYRSELQTAAEEIRAAGAALDLGEASDVQLVADYAVFHHLNTDKGADLPRYLTSRINRRKVRRRSS